MLPPRFCGAGGSALGVPPLDAEWAEVVAHARRHFPRAGLAFADLHAALAEAATGDKDALQRRVDALSGLAREGRLPPGEVAPALCAGMAALARADMAGAADLLAAALPDLLLGRGGQPRTTAEGLFEDSS